MAGTTSPVFLTSAILLHLQVGTTTWLTHFKDLTDAITQAERKILESKVENTYELLHNVVPRKFKLSTDLLNISNTSQATFANALNQHFLDNNVLSFSFVRHPFER